MAKTFAAVVAACAVASTSAASVPDGTWPTSAGTVQYTEPYTVKAGEVFDGGLKTYERSDISCEGQTESGSSTAVFLVEAGGPSRTPSSAPTKWKASTATTMTAPSRTRGGTTVSTVTGGGARNADDKVIQHNGYGTVKIDGFYVDTFGKLYRSCGTCGNEPRKVTVSNVLVVNPSVSLVTVNENYGDEATLSNIYIKSSDSSYAVCAWSQGNANGEPTELGNGIKAPLCQYSESDINVNGAVSKATGASSNSTSPATPTPAITSGSGASTPSNRSSSSTNGGEAKKSSNSKNKGNDNKKDHGKGDSDKKHN
ncbi:hypothetical protein ON010_g7459 [Phytophthora cinnamomi]|nr:hypothetical protein ON010_g7459 [Phytophthora cinnamomi]